MHIKLELLTSAINDLVSQRLSGLDMDVQQIADTTAIQALSEIKDVVDNDTLTDFDVVEQIVCIFEKYHIDAGARHDF